CRPELELPVPGCDDRYFQRCCLSWCESSCDGPGPHDRPATTHQYRSGQRIRQKADLGCAIYSCHHRTTCSSGTNLAGYCPANRLQADERGTTETREVGDHSAGSLRTPSTRPIPASLVSNGLSTKGYRVLRASSRA